MQDVTIDVKLYVFFHVPVSKDRSKFSRRMTSRMSRLSSILFGPRTLTCAVKKPFDVRLNGQSARDLNIPIRVASRVSLSQDTIHYVLKGFVVRTVVPVDVS